MIIHALQTGTPFELEIFRIDYRIRGTSMGTGIGYRNEARARMKGRYGAGKICTCPTSLIKTIDGEFPVRQSNANHNCAYTRLQQILSQDSSRTSVHFVPFTAL